MSTIGPKDGPEFVDGDSYSSFDGGKSWFAVGKGSACVGVKEAAGIKMLVSHVDMERKIVYYEPAKDSN